jgi:hypothetical protein
MSGRAEQENAVTNGLDALRGGFDAADTNKNGVLDEKEFCDYLRSQQRTNGIVHELSEADIKKAYTVFAGEDKVVDKAEWSEFLDTLDSSIRNNLAEVLEKDCLAQCCLTFTACALPLAVCCGFCTLGIACLPMMLGAKVTGSRLQACVAKSMRKGIDDRAKNPPTAKVADKPETKPDAPPKKDEAPAKAETTPEAPPKKDEAPAKAETTPEAPPKKEEAPAKAETTPEAPPKKEEAPAKAEPDQA